MVAADFLRFVFSSLAAHRLRSALTALGICVGIAAVILLTSLGAGLQQFVTSEFTQFGTNFININPAGHRIRLGSRLPGRVQDGARARTVASA